MKKADGVAGAVMGQDLPDTILQRRHAFMKVPIGDVQAGIMVDLGVGHEAGGEVHPFLVGEHARAGIGKAVFAQHVRPPAQEGQSPR